MMQIAVDKENSMEVNELLGEDIVISPKNETLEEKVKRLEKEVKVLNQTIDMMNDELVGYINQIWSYLGVDGFEGE